MIEALNNGVAGINAQQLEFDVIAHNIANVNTTGYKRGRPLFAELLHQAMADSGVPANNIKLPNVQRGAGVAITGVGHSMRQGRLVETGRQFDFAIDGRGFLKIELLQDGVCFTRGGALKVDYGGFLTTAGGYRVVPEIQIPSDCMSVGVRRNGVVFVTMPDGTGKEVGRILLYDFVNAPGLTSAGEGLYRSTPESGEPREGAPSEKEFGVIRQGFLESSNTVLAEEMVDLIEASRALGLNIRLVRTADEMWGVANNITGS